MGEEIYRGRIVNLRKETVSLPNGATTTLELMEHPGASAIVAVERGEVILIRQYRFAASGFLWEIPAGTLDPNEEPDACAKRELREEAGVDASDWTKLGQIFTVPGFCNEVIHVYLAQELSAAAFDRDQDEVITEVRRVALDEALAMMERGEIQDAKSCYGLFRAAQHFAKNAP